MSTRDPRIDGYIANSADFAKPILNHLRDLIYKACPEVEEKLKWGFPHFDYKGVFVSMAAFKGHCAFSFWKAKLMPDPEKILQKENREAMGNFGRITSLKDLPSDKIILDYLNNAKKLNEAGIKVTPKKPTEKEKKDLKVPDDLLVHLEENRKAKETFDKFSYSHRKEYIEWIIEAKTEATRIKRLKTTIEWLSEGKGRNWKYQKE